MFISAQPLVRSSLQAMTKNANRGIVSLGSTRFHSTSSKSMGGSMSTTLSSTGKVHSLGHQYEYIPKQAANYHTNQSEVRESGDDVWCVVGASGETKNFKGVPMGAFAASDTFSPAWRRSM